MIFEFKYLSNYITLLGLIIVLVSYYIYLQTSNSIFILISLFGFSCDYWDGYIARKYIISSSFGNILDKLVDKICQILLLLILIIKFNVSPNYLFLYILREIIIYLMRVNNMKSYNSTFYGKLKTLLFPLLLILFHYNIPVKYIYLNLLTLFNFVTLLI